MMVFLLVTSFNLLAHEGHGEAPRDPSRFGGLLSGVVEAKKMKKNENNPVLYKAELVRSEDGTLRLYVFDLGMKSIGLDQFSQKIEASVENIKNKIKLNFSLEKSGEYYLGKMPKVTKRPFDLFFKLKDNKGKELFIGYDNLD